MTLFLQPILAVFGIDDIIYIAIVLAASAASTYASYSASEQAKDQAEMNSKAQSDALAAEAAQKQQEISEQQRRKAVEQHRFRASQLAEISGQGIQITGTPLDIMANTAVIQQQEMNDIAYGRDTTAKALEYQRQNALASGSQQAAQYRQQQGATLLSGAASIASTGYGAYGKYQDYNDQTGVNVDRAARGY